MRRGPLHVQVDCGIAANQRVRPGYRVHCRADAVDGRIRGLAVWRRCERALEKRVTAMHLRLGNGRYSGHPSERGSQLGGSVGVPDDVDRLTHARRDVLVEDLLAY